MNPRILLPVALTAGLLSSMMITLPDSSGPVSTRVESAPVGEVLLYDLEYTGRSAIMLPDRSEMIATIAIAGDLEIAGADEGRLIAKFTAVETADLQFGNRTLFPELLGHAVTLEHGAEGQIEALYFAPETPVLTQQLLHSVLLDIQVLDGGGETWTAEQHDTNGALVGAWRRIGNQILRTDEHYTSLKGFSADALSDHRLNGQFVASLRADGIVETVSSQTHLVLPGRADIQTSVHQTLTNQRRRTSWAPDLSKLERHAPDFVPGAALAGKNSLRDRVGTMSSDRMVAALEEGVAESDSDFAWQVTALIRLDPSVAKALAELHARGGLAAGSDDLIVDLLANAGTREAQQALITILERADVQEADSYGRTVQAVVLVPEPTAETVGALAALGTTQTGTQARLTRNAAAIAAGRLAEAGNDAPARMLAAETAHLLSQMQEPHSQAELLLVLGNLGQSEHLEAVMAYASSDDARVRAASARAMRRMDEPVARELLIAMTEDEDSYVQSQALRSLDAATMTNEDFEDLASRVAEGAVFNGAEEWLLRLAQSDDRGFVLLDALVSRGVSSASLRGRIEAAL